MLKLHGSPSLCVKALVYLWSRGAGTGFATSFHFRAPAPSILDSRKVRENQRVPTFTMSYATDCIIPYQSVLPKADELLAKVVQEPNSWRVSLR
jgi:hypothetical protein